MPRAIIVWLYFLFIAISEAGAQSPGMVPDTAPRFAVTVDAVAALTGIPRLREPDALGSNAREVRLWVGFGTGIPHRLLRVVDTPTGAAGQLVYWWSGEERRGTFHGTPEAEAQLRAGHRAVIEGVRHQMTTTGCSILYQSPRLEACEYVFPVSPDWSEVLTRIDDLDPWTLPDPRTLSPPVGGGLDGISLLVEARTPDGYRTYTYWLPQRYPERPELARATSLMGLMPEAGHP